MKKQGVTLYYITIGWVLLTVVVGAYFLFGATNLTADVTARNGQSGILRVRIDNLVPGEPATLKIGRTPVVVWRRDQQEILSALAQLDLGFSNEELQAALDNGTLVNIFGAEVLHRVEWFVASPINVGGFGCVVLTQAGDFGGFLDPCQKVHFDLWGRPRKGPTTHDLTVITPRFDDGGKSLILDLRDLPAGRKR